MNTFVKRELITALQTAVHETISGAEQLNAMPVAALAKAPNPASWSILQILYHLNTYNDYYLPLTAAAIGRNSPIATQDTYKPGWLGDYFTKAMLPDKVGMQVKGMKAFKTHVATQNYADPAAIQRFIDSQQQLLQQLNQATSANISKSCIPVSIAKFLNMKVGDTYRFIVAHQQRHFLQINKVLQANGEKLLLPVNYGRY